MARLGGGDFKQTALVPVSAKAHRMPPPTPPDRRGSLDRATRSQQNSFSKKRFGALSPTSPAGPDSAWVPLLLSHTPWAFHPLILQVGSGHMGPQLSTGSCRHCWPAGPAPSPPGRQAAVPQPGSLKPNPSFQLQHERAPGPAFPGDPAACRSHGQGIFPA